MAETFALVHKRKDNVKYIIVPRKSEIKPDEWVIISNDTNIINRMKKEEQDGRQKGKN